VRVAYTIEQCWHRVPGGTAVAALEVARELVGLASRHDIEVVGVAGRHRHAPAPDMVPPMAVRGLPLSGPYLYEAWTRFRWPKVESVVDDADVVHSTTVIPAATKLPHVVTLHDVAFLAHPEFFTARGNRIFRRGLDIIRDEAALVLCSSQSTIEDCATYGIDRGRLRHVPLGVRSAPASDADIERVRQAYSLPDNFALFVGTLEPRKNLPRLLAACAEARLETPLVIVGAQGWGESVQPTPGVDVRFVGFVPSGDLAAMYAAADVLCYPSILEGFGLPILEAMAQGTPVVTSAGTSTEEVAGGAAELCDPTDVSSIAGAIVRARSRGEELSQAGRARAASMTWANTAQRTLHEYRTVCGTTR
jgi:glycosyltransferase involved in cell wall biosynthesis